MVEIASGPQTPRSRPRLYLAEPTVKTHVGRISAGLGLRDRVRIVTRAYETGPVRRGRP
ncbi:hypothetical protein ACI797_07450 [Geodermatophilus sp. SYSU D00691]